MSSQGLLTSLSEHLLPHPRVPLRVILTTHAAVAKAFELLRVCPPDGFHLGTAMEDEITRQLLSLLEDRLLDSEEIEGFDRRRIRNVVRPEIPNFDGRHPAKRPDLVFFLLRRERFKVRSSLDGIFAECKPIDRAHSIGRHYCDKGILRFVNGDYAWAMREGMMIAYVRGQRSIRNHLAPTLAAASRYSKLGSPTPPVAVQRSLPLEGAEPLSSSTHQRRFPWPNGKGLACEIQIFHSWHRCD